MPITRTTDAEEVLQRRIMFVQNAIDKHEIELADDCTDTNIHFHYKSIEITSDMCTPPNNFYIDPDTNEVAGIIRKIHIHMNLLPYMEDEGEDGIDDDDDSDEVEGLYITYNDRLKKNFPSMYVDNETVKQYASAGAKLPLFASMLDDENDSIFAFSHRFGLTIGTQETTFLAPEYTFKPDEVIFWACNIINKILDYYLKEDKEEESNLLFDLDDDLLDDDDDDY